MRSTIAIVIIVLMIVVAVYTSRLLAARAMRSVVAVFRQHGAVNAKKATTLRELGLVPRRSMFGGFFRTRDYRQTAMRILEQNGIIKPAEGQRYYLSEEALNNSRVKTFANIEK